MVANAFSALGGGFVALENVLLIMSKYVNCWFNEEDVVLQIAKMLKTLAKSKICRDAMVLSPTFKNMVSHLLHHIARLPSSIHRLSRLM